MSAPDLIPSTTELCIDRKTFAPSPSSGETGAADFVSWFPLSWISIIIGIFLALAITVMLHSVGLDLFVSMTLPDASTASRLERLGGVTNVFVAVSGMFALFIAGVAANTLSRLSGGGRTTLCDFGIWTLTALLLVAFLSAAG